MIEENLVIIDEHTYEIISDYLDEYEEELLFFGIS